jgi:CBS-domain-containing membrane protein
MKLSELMTRDVITIGPEAPLKEAARRMIEAGVSGLPVTDEHGDLIGVITEADFVKEEANRRAHRRARLLRWLDREESYHEHRIVADVMTRVVITLGPEADHAEAARLMKKSNIKRVPVLSSSGELVGLVSRTDILRAFARPDADIVEEIRTRVAVRIMWIDPKLVQIISEDGNVTLAGELETKSDVTLLTELTRRLDGVVSVEDRLTWKVDDTRLQMVPPPPRHHR